MINNKKVIVVMPAYNAAKTLEKTYAEIPKDVVDDVIVVDDSSRDATVQVSKRLGLKTYVHQENKGYGGNQKTCYKKALEAGADIVVMLHPDYQYTPKLIPAMVSLIDSGEFDVVLGSRIIGQNAVRGGMPLYKYISNRFLTLYDNLILGQKLSEYHTGLRAYSRKVLEELPISANSDDFVFDNQILVQAVYFGFRIGEIACPAKYERDSSSINFRRSVVYGMGVLRTGVQYLLEKSKIARFGIFKKVFLMTVLAISVFLSVSNAYAVSTKFNSAERLFLNGDYRAAADESERLFCKYTSAEIKNDAAYLAALSYLKLKEWQKAREYLEYVINNSDDPMLIGEAEELAASLSAGAESARRKASDREPSDSGAQALFSVQIGCFRNKANALRLGDKFTRRRYTTRVLEDRSEGQPVYKVKVGKFASKEDAIVFARKLKRAGYPTAIVEY